jgi:hypothetical protein
MNRYLPRVLPLYYLRKLEMKNRQLLPLLEMYNIGNEDAGSRDSISDLLVDFLWG